MSNCPRCQIIISPKGNILMLDLFERRRRKKAYVPDFIRGIKERAICLREPSFLPSSLNCIFFFTCMYTTFLLSPLLSSVLGIGVKENDCQRYIVMWLSAFTDVSSASKYRTNFNFKVSTKLKLQNLDKTSVSESLHCIGE